MAIAFPGRFASLSLARRAQRLASRRKGGLLAAAACATALLAPRTAAAYDELAVACEDAPDFCQTAPIGFEHTDALPIEWGFDTGWVPQGSPLQVHLAAAVYANTRISLAGDLVTTWPEGLTLATPGRPLGGDLYYHYGVDFAAEASFNVSVFGQNVGWQGPIPYVPQVHLAVEAQSEFDAWGFSPGISATGSSPLQRIATVSLVEMMGASIPGLDGGFELDTAVDLTATYVTDRMVLQTTDGELVSGGLITTEDGLSSTYVPKGPFVELDAHPEGHVDYEGTVHFVPAFFVSFLGQHWSIPVADLPIPFPATQTSWVFDPVRVHVPLPDIDLPTGLLDFGPVEVGSDAVLDLPIDDIGEAPLRAVLLSTDPVTFMPADAMLLVDPLATSGTTVRFRPASPGAFEAWVFIGSNDPDKPSASVLVRGTGVGDPSIVRPLDDDGAGENVTDDGGCACRAAGEPKTRSGLPAVLALGLASAAAGLRRRRARR